MHLQEIRSQLDGLSTDEFYAPYDELASSWAAIPDLITKVWLDSPETNTFGGVYTWESREAVDAYLKSDLFAAAVNDHDEIERPTRVTRGLAAVAA